MRYYVVKKDTPLWSEGAILKPNDDGNGYVAISELWNASDVVKSEYLSKRIIEEQPEWFEQVYEVGILGKAKYLTKVKARDLYNNTFKKDNK